MITSKDFSAQNTSIQEVRNWEGGEVFNYSEGGESNYLVRYETPIERPLYFVLGTRSALLHSHNLVSFFQFPNPAVHTSLYQFILSNGYTVPIPGVEDCQVSALTGKRCKAY